MGDSWGLFKYLTSSPGREGRKIPRYAFPSRGGIRFRKMKNAINDNFITTDIHSNKGINQVFTWTTRTTWFIQDYWTQIFYGQNRFFIISLNYQKCSFWAVTIDLEKFVKKKFKNFSDFGVVTDFQIENFHGSGTWRHFLWHDSDGPSQDLQFEPYDDLWVALGKKLLRNYEKFMTKS